MPSEVAKASSMVTSFGVSMAVASNVELRRLAGELLVSVVRREGDLERALFADGDADELRLESRDEGAGADLHDNVLAFAALERARR
jgi:hypothetical protein